MATKKLSKTETAAAPAKKPRERECIKCHTMNHVARKVCKKEGCGGTRFLQKDGLIVDTAIKAKPSQSATIDSNSVAIFALRHGSVAKAVEAVEKVKANPTMEFVAECGGVAAALAALHALDRQMTGRTTA